MQAKTGHFEFAETPEKTVGLLPAAEEAHDTSFLQEWRECLVEIAEGAETSPFRAEDCVRMAQYVAYSCYAGKAYLAEASSFTPTAPRKLLNSTALNNSSVRESFSPLELLKNT